MRIAPFYLTLATAPVLLLFAACGTPTGDDHETEPISEKGAYQRICQQCHGENGEGNLELRSPSIAGQPAWYLQRQIEKFRSGQRGADPRDTFGQQMRAIALTLEDADIAEAIETVTSFRAFPTESTLTADSEHGRQIYQEQCIDCHRYNGSGELVFGSSPLTAFQDWYLADQLDKFRTGIRGYHADDEKGSQMRHLASYLAESDTRDVTAYIATLAKRYPPEDQRRRR